MNRGSRCVTLTRPSRGPRFNEAPIHESGKWIPLIGPSESIDGLQ